MFLIILIQTINPIDNFLKICIIVIRRTYVYCRRLRLEMAPDTPAREPEMQDTPPCHSSAADKPGGYASGLFLLNLVWPNIFRPSARKQRAFYCPIF